MAGRSYLFGEFELDGARFELQRNGQPVKLERIPLELLILLAEAHGAVVSRQEIVDRLWGKDVFADTEHGINTAIRKIRQALKDDPDEPRFVLTVTGKGYRFVAELNEPPQVAIQPPPSQPETIQPQTSEHSLNPGVARLSEPATGAASSKVFSRVAVAFLLMGVTLATWGFRKRLFAHNEVAQIHSIAVLPLANLSGDASQDYFADGMTDEIITALAKNHSLRVISRTSAMHYKGTTQSLPEIARQLNADGILEGSVSHSADHVHMTVQLIYAPTDTHVWAESYDRELAHAYSLSEDLASTVATEVKAATSPGPPSAPRYINPEAHDAYLHGRYFWFMLNVANTLPYFEKAIKLQPDYAAAWSGLADTYALAAMMTQPPGEVADKSCSAAEKSVELDPLLPDAHNSMAGCYLFFRWDPARAEVESRRALELNPNYAEGHHLLSYILEVQQRYAEGEVEAKRTTELDPFIHPWELGAFYISERKFDAAIGEFKMQIAAHPQDPDMAANISKAYWLKGMYKDSQEELERALELQGDVTGKADAHKAWLAGGEPAVERWGAERLKAMARKQYTGIEAVASIIAFTQNKDETLKYLEASYRAHDPDLIFIQCEPLFDFLHSDPRYRALVRKMGLPIERVPGR